MDERQSKAQSWNGSVALSPHLPCKFEFGTLAIVPPLALCCGVAQEAAKHHAPVCSLPQPERWGRELGKNSKTHGLR